MYSSISALKLDQKDPAIALNYAIFLYNKSSQEKPEEENNGEIYADAISKIQLFDCNVITTDSRFAPPCPSGAVSSYNQAPTEIHDCVSGGRSLLVF